MYQLMSQSPLFIIQDRPCMSDTLPVDVNKESPFSATHTSNEQDSRQDTNSIWAGYDEPEDFSEVSFGRSFPVEIHERIIDVLWVDTVNRSHRSRRQDLLACALTCRAWLPRSRFNLFYEIRLRDSRELYSFASLVTIYPHLDEFVKELRINNSQVLGVFPAVLARKLTGVNSLRIGGNLLEQLRIPPFHLPSFMPIAGFTSISRLEIAYTTFPTFTAFARLVSSLPSLSDLTCRRLSWTASRLGKGVSPRGRFHTKLKVLHVMACPVEDISNWLLSLTPTALLHLEELAIPWISSEDVEPIGRLLWEIGAGLRRLIIGFPPPSKENLLMNIEQHLKLANNTRLELLHLALVRRGPSFASDNEAELNWGWAHSTLSLVSSNHIKRVWITIPHYTEGVHLDALRCDLLDEMLSQAQFTTIEELVFICGHSFALFETQVAPDEWFHWLHSEIPLRFPLTYTRGIVRYQHGSAWDELYGLM
ncbi:hypothetical protein AcW1_002398 [Taiwanofungus camphoratus]|nr:hypothetical protein AcV5_010407 [Antrodia cinnamomea]KAI0944768.1 hypothetical protein AcW1_002398 [Antrodia cinnamomea]